MCLSLCVRCSFLQHDQVGSAFQILSDSSYIVSSSPSAVDHWRLTCPDNTAAPQRVLQPCQMCRIYLPCDCSLTARDFILPPRMCGDATDYDSSGNMTYQSQSSKEGRVDYFYTLNTRVVKSVHWKSGAAQKASYASLMNKLWTDKLRVPTVKFHQSRLAYEMPPYVSESYQRGPADLRKVLENYKKGQASYDSEMDAMLAKATDMSDVVSGRTFNLKAALADVFGGIFSENFALVVGVLFTSSTCLLFAFVFTTFMFVSVLASILTATNKVVVNLSHDDDSHSQHSSNSSSSSEEEEEYEIDNSWDEKSPLLVATSSV